MEFNLRDTISATIILFAVLDIIGSLPIIMSMKQRGIKIVPRQITLTAAALLLGFMFLGEATLGFFGVDLNSFAVAGGIVLFIIGMEMILGVDFFKNDATAAASIVPLSFPILAGPGSFTTILALRSEYDVLNVIIALVLNMLFVYMVIALSDKISKLVGANGIYVLKKFFGVILVAIAVRLFTTNLALLLERYA